MTRITPRTCLYPLTGSLLLTFALSIGLTFVSNHHCYAGVCGEVLFPLQARLHVLVWYCWVSISVAFLAIRAFSPELRGMLKVHVLKSKMPVVGKHMAVSGTLVTIWILSLYGIISGIWWIRVRDYFTQRGQEAGIDNGNTRLAAIALTGHYADVTMGMALLPISRHSALASFFKLSVSTTLAFHMIMAYTLFGLVVTHGLLYVSWLPVFESLSSTLRKVYPVLNPTYYYNEVWPGDKSSLGLWRASLIFTGLVTTTVMFIIFLTTLPPVRRKHFNIFYFTHLLAIFAVVIICLHASTMFYCTAPGLAMWLLDWGMRLYELREKLDGKVTTFGKGWYCVSLQLPRRRLDGCACTSPLAHFYIHHSDSSTRELHPFTTITHLASQNIVTPKSSDTLLVQFLFRKKGQSEIAKLSDTEDVRTDGFAKFFAVAGLAKRGQIKRKPQWTDRLGGLADPSVPLQARPLYNDGEDLLTSPSTGPGTVETSRAGSIFTISGPTGTQSGVDIPIRLEGPYFTPADPSKYRTVVCLVAGTGVSGAIAIAGAFAESLGERERPECMHRGLVHRRACVPREKGEGWERCIILWSVREDDFVDLPFFQGIKVPGLEIRPHLTGKGRPRLDLHNALASIQAEYGSSVWVYLSGPSRFIAGGEEACKACPGIDFYAARWDI